MAYLKLCFLFAGAVVAFVFTAAPVTAATVDTAVAARRSDSVRVDALPSPVGVKVARRRDRGPRFRGRREMRRHTREFRRERREFRRERRGFRRDGRRFRRDGRQFRRDGHRFRRFDRRHRRFGRHYGKRRRFRGRSLYYYGLPFAVFPYSYGYRPYYAPRYYGGRCEIWRRRCAANWGYGTPNFYGCMRYHRCY
jgi:hypothetical protein